MKAQSQVRVQQLMTQFPVIRGYLPIFEFLHLGNWQWEWDSALDKIHIYVRRADENLLLHQPRLVDGIRVSACDNDHKGMLGTVHEVISVVNSDDDILATIGYWNAQPNAGTNDRVRDLFTKDGIKDEAKYLIRMVVTCWYKEIEDHHKQGLQSPHGEFVEREIEIVIYKAPKQGFAKLVMETDVTVNVRLHMDHMIRAICRQDSTFNEANRQLDALVDLFVDRVYSRGLRAVIDASRKKGMSGVYGGTKLMSWVMCSRVMLTFKKGDDSVTFIAAEEGSPRMGVQSIDATLPGARAMVEEVIREWEASPLPATERHKDDENVNVGF